MSTKNAYTAALLSAVGTAALLLAAVKYNAPFLPQMSTPSVVAFDVTRLANAQRAIAAGLLDQDSDAILTLSRIGRESEAAIRDVAGPGTVVLVKQAIVAGEIPDITDAVLTRLGLPTNVPTVDPMRYLTDVAPTELSISASRLVVEDRAQQAARNYEERVQRAEEAQLENLLP